MWWQHSLLIIWYRMLAFIWEQHRAIQNNPMDKGKVLCSTRSMNMDKYHLAQLSVLMLQTKPLWRKKKRKTVVAEILSRSKNKPKPGSYTSWVNYKACRWYGESWLWDLRKATVPHSIFGQFLHQDKDFFKCEAFLLRSANGFSFCFCSTLWCMKV